MDLYQHTAQLYNKVAQAYQDKFMDLDLYNDTYDTFCRQITKPDAAILEIGCGPGNITRYLLKQSPNYKITGIDFAPEMVKLAQSNNPAAVFTVMDCRDINTIPATFDGILCGFTFPYLSKEDCQKLVLDCSNLLTTGGIFYFSLVEDEYRKSGYRLSSSGDQFYFYYHQAAYLEQYLQQNGLVIMNTYRICYPLKDDESETHLIYIAKRK